MINSYAPRNVYAQSVLVEPAQHAVIDAVTETWSYVPNVSIEALRVGQEVTHFVAAPGYGRHTYRIVRIDEQGAWGVSLKNGVREFSAGSAR